MIFFPSLIALTSRRKGFLLRKLSKYSEVKNSELLWNGLISFYYENYLFLSLLGWTSLWDLRFGLIYSATENFSSILGILLFVFSITFPILVAVTQLRHIKRLKEGFKPGALHSQKTEEQYILEIVNKYGTYENYQK